MINNWKEYLLSSGFEKSGRREFRRLSKPVSSFICESVYGVGNNRVRIRPSVEIHDPFVEGREYHVLHLSGDLMPDGICVRPVGLPAPFWIAPDQEESVFGVLRSCLNEWFRYWTDPLNLIRYREEPVDFAMTRPTKVAACRHEFGGAMPLRKSPSDIYQLSLLYQHIGNYESALAYGKKVLEFYNSMPRDTYDGEPARTERQIKFLKHKAGS